MSEFISLEQLATIDDREERIVEVPEWGGKAVKLKAPSLAQLREAEGRATVGGRVDDTRHGLVLLCLCLAEPKLDPDQHLPLLERLSPGALTRLIVVVAELAGQSDEEAAAAAAAFQD